MELKYRCNQTNCYEAEVCFHSEPHKYDDDTCGEGPCFNECECIKIKEGDKC